MGYLEWLAVASLLILIVAFAVVDILDQTPQFLPPKPGEMTNTEAYDKAMGRWLF